MFLHGIEHIDLPQDLMPANDVVTAVIGLVGTADGTTASQIEHNKLFLVANDKDDAKFGEKGTIPEALRAIRLQTSRRGSALVFVVSVANSSATVTPQQIIGMVDPTGVRTGLKLFETARGIYGFEPMIYIAPRFSAIAAVKNELQAIANKNEAMAYIDSPDGMTFNEALLSRGTTGQFANLDEGCKLLFPHFLVANPAFNPEQPESSTNQKFLNVPMSAYNAGLRAKVDLEQGWHWSSSNHRVFGVEGMDVDLSFSLGDPTCEANMLNAVGITTAVAIYGRGINEWGNYTTGFPGNTALDAFECVRRTRAIMKRAIEGATIPFLDRPFTQANVDSIRDSVNQYLNKLVGENKLIYGKCFYKPEHNPIINLAVGHLTFLVEYTPCIPMQRLTFLYKINLEQLKSIL